MAGIFEQRYRVRYSDAGVSGFLRPWMFFNLFQDIASVHAFNEGVSALHMADKGLSWVVRAYSLEINSLPVWNEELNIKTWRSPYKNLYELREYEVKGNSEQICARAKSAWILVRKDNGHPVRLGKNLPGSFASGPDVLFDLHDIPDPAAGRIHAGDFEVFGWDIDYNRHANNAVFIKWMIEALPSDIPETAITGIDMVFMQSAYLGDRLECFMEKKSAADHDLFICLIASSCSAHGTAKAVIRCSPAFMSSSAFSGFTSNSNFKSGVQ